VVHPGLESIRERKAEREAVRTALTQDPEESILDEARQLLAEAQKIVDDCTAREANGGPVCTEEDASEACDEYLNLLVGRCFGWQTQLARATRGELPATKAMRSLEKFRTDLNWRRQFAAERILQVGMERHGLDWYCIKGWPFVENVERLLEAERSWAPLAGVLDAKLDEAQQLLESLVAAG
jgi:hypothetical protein